MNAVIINGRGDLKFVHEYWSQITVTDSYSNIQIGPATPATFTFQGTKAVIFPLGGTDFRTSDGVDSSARDEGFITSNTSYPYDWTTGNRPWIDRTKYDDYVITYDRGGVYAGAPTRFESYDNNLITKHAFLEFSGAGNALSLHLWSEGPRR